MLGVNARERSVRRQPRRGGEVRQRVRRTRQGNHISLPKKRSQTIASNMNNENIYVYTEI